ncbi:phospholipase [Serratia ficaria]|uniref:phospholipase n=1 Tax=Serratia ficaria TaxID=61651 RepID=UPI0021BDB261|nr:phospholipase [Serratia ficaria]
MDAGVNVKGGKAMRLIYFTSEDLEPELFARILKPADARYELERHYLFGGSSLLSISERHNITRNVQTGIGVSSYQENTNMKRGVFDEINRGSLLAIERGWGSWSPAKYLFFINGDGLLQLYSGNHLPAQYPVKRIIERYEDMVRKYAVRARPTAMPPRQNTTGKPSLPQAIATTVASAAAVVREALRPMTKQQRWQARKYLIGRGERSRYPDARIAAQRLAQNNVAVEKAKLAQNIYRTTNPLSATPGVPEGWMDMSNDKDYLNRFGLNPGALFDNQENPNFLARVYAPAKTVFGNDMSPTVVFRGSRLPELPNGKLNAIEKILVDHEVPEIKNIDDWSNNINQAFGQSSEYYSKAVDIGNRLKFSTENISISGHSLGGGLASAASVASGKPGWTFNASGLNSRTVERYGGSLIGHENSINAYRVGGEVLTKLQEINLWSDFQDVHGNIGLFAAKEELSSRLPDSVGIKHTLEGGIGSANDRHAIQQAIDCIEQEKDDDIATISYRM